MKKSNTKEFCQEFNIGQSAFKHKERKAATLEKVRKTHNVIEQKEGKENFYYYEPKNDFIKLLSLKNIGKLDIETLEIIMKAIIEDKVVTIQSEFAKLAGKSQSSISNHFNFLKDNNIIMPTPTETVIIPHRETGEILSKYEKKIGSYVYYDETKDGSIIRLSEGKQELAHEMFKKLWAVELQQLSYTQQRYSIYETDLKDFKLIVKQLVWARMNKAFNLNDGRRKIKPIINRNIRQQLKDYFKQQDNVACV